MKGTLAEVRLYAGNFVPFGWNYCEGQLLSISPNAALFSLLGTTFGGDGVANFALPDFRGRTPVGVGQGTGLSNITMGQAAGSETATLQLGNLPAHNHTISGNIIPQASSDHSPGPNPAGKYIGAGAFYSGSGDLAGMAPISTLALTISTTGNSDSFSSMQPYLGIRYIICVSGPYPCQQLAKKRISQYYAR